MGKPTKTVKEKLQTKLDNLSKDHSNISITDNTVSYSNSKLFSFDDKRVVYNKIRVSTQKIDPFYKEEYSVVIILDHNNLAILSSNMLNPPSGTKVVFNVLKTYIKKIEKIVIGVAENTINNKEVSITKELYDEIIAINKEESSDKKIRVENRSYPFIKSAFGLENKNKRTIKRNYKLLLKEIIASKKFSSSDIVNLSKELSPGKDVKVVIDQQIEKQAKWLLDIMKQIVDAPKLSKGIAQEFGNKFFNYHKKDISGPEKLMEKILTDYGKNIIFGVPALLNTDKYIITEGLPKVQFDIILINNLSDIEIVELKRPDTYVLSYDESRSKFFPSKELAIAIGQSERYITSIYKDNDEDFMIGGQKIRDYIHSQVGGSIELSVTRPSALIVIGTIHRLTKEYQNLTDKIKSKVSEKDYKKNLEQAYRELRSTHKNITIITYTELIESTELRLKSDGVEGDQ